MIDDVLKKAAKRSDAAMLHELSGVEAFIARLARARRLR